MAKGKGTNFGSDYEKKKWAALESNAGMALQHIAKGVASAQDVQAVSTALKGLNSLAKETFDNAVSAAEVSAKKFQAQYDKLNSEVNEAQLSAYELALNKALAEFAPDLIGQIKDILELDGLEQEDRDRLLGNRLSDIQLILPEKRTEFVSPDDLLAANDLLAEHLDQQDDAKWPERKRDLLESIAETFSITLRKLADTINQEKQQRRAQPHQEYHARPQSDRVPRLAAPNQQSQDYEIEPPSMLSMGLSLVGAGREHNDQRTSRSLSEATNTRTSGTALNSDTPTITLSQNAEKSITKAATDQSDLYTKLLEFLQHPEGDKSGEADDTEDKADTVATALKRKLGMGDKKKKDKDDDDNSNWLMGLGAALAALVMDPQLFTGIGKAIHDLLTWDNIKEAAEKSWEFMKDQGKTIVDWVLDKLGINKKGPVDKNEADASRVGGGDGAKLTPNKPGDTKHADPNDPAVQAQMAKMNTGDKAPNAVMPELQKNPGEKASTKSVLNHYLSMFGLHDNKDDVADRDKTVNASLHKGADGTGYVYNKAGDSTTTVGASNVNNDNSTTMGANSNRSTVGGSTTNNTSSSTTSVPGTPASVSPGSVNPPPGTAAASTNPSVPGSIPGQGSPQIGMSSFGFHSSTDDSLPLMNSTFFMH